MSQALLVQYNLFIVYAPSDHGWVEGYLLPELNLPENRVRRASDFILGASVTEEYQNAVANSRYTLLILSPAYLADTWSEFGTALSTYLSVEEQARRVIPLFLRPCQPGLTIRHLVSLDCTDTENWALEIARLRNLLNQPIAPPAKVSCPYPGMAAFHEDDHAHFYGRDAEIKELVECLRLHPFLAVIGPSGSGKSSLVQAGLLPALRKSSFFGQADWLPLNVRPGSTPSTNLHKQANAQLDLATGKPRTNSNQHLCLIIDQFEEVFSLSSEAMEGEANEEITHFFQALLRLIGQPNLYIVLTLRDDFYAKMMASALRDQFKAHHVDIPPLRGAGLRQAIARPAQNVGVYIEDTLVERLVAESSEQPGALPFIQETLVLLWDRLERRYLSARVYEALVSEADKEKGPASRSLSGIQIAMARRADAALAELTDPVDQLIAQRTFMRLIQFGEGRADTRRQQTVNELSASGDAKAKVTQVLGHLIQCRLLTSSGDATNGGQRIDIAHEKLIEGWPTLQGWIKELKAAEQTRRRLEAKAVEYQYLEGKGGLLDALELAEAKSWLESPPALVLGCSNNLLALIKKSQSDVNPGWHIGGSIGLLAGMLAFVATLGWVYYYLTFIDLPTAVTSSILLILFSLSIVLIASFVVLKRHNPHFLQKLSYTIGKNKMVGAEMTLAVVISVVLWVWLYQAKITTEIDCSNLGLQREPGITNVVIQNVNFDSIKAELFVTSLERISNYVIFAKLFDDLDTVKKCNQFFGYSLSLERQISDDQKDVSYVVNGIKYVTSWIKSSNPITLEPVREPESNAGCRAIWQLAYQFANRQNFQTSFETDIETQAPNSCNLLLAYEQGYRSYILGQYDDASNALNQIARDFPFYIPTHTILARIYSAQGKYAAALKEAKQAIQWSKKPKGPFYADLGSVCYRMRDFACAETAYQQALQIDHGPYWLSYYNSLATVYREAQKYDLAMKTIHEIDNIMSTEPKRNTTEQQILLWKNRGLLAFRQGQWAEALTWLKKADTQASNLISRMNGLDVDKGTLRYGEEIGYYLALSVFQRIDEESVYYLALTSEAQQDATQACFYWQKYKTIPEIPLVQAAERRKDATAHTKNLGCP